MWTTLMWILGYVPLWVWAVVFFAGFGALYFYFGPIITLIWNWTPRWLKLTIGGALSLLAAVAYGRYQGAKTEREMQKHREENAVQDRKEIHDEVKNLSNADLDKRFDKWVR